MANNAGNLKPVRSTEEARRRGANGGRKSGETRRKQKTFREIAKAIMPTMIKDEEMQKVARAFGIEDDVSVKMLTVLGVIRAACGGDVKAFDRLVELLGEQEGEESGKMESLIKGLKNE